MKRLFLFFSVFFLTMQVALGQPIAPRQSNVLAQPVMEEDAASLKLAQAFAIVSPRPGTWANKQPLVLEVPGSCEVFYSFSGSHPMESGFAYDGPVMLEAEGDVSVRIALVFPHGDAMVYTIDYSVEPARNEADLNLDVNLGGPLVLYSIGQQLVIPEGFSYRLGNSPFFLPGRQILSLEGGTFPKRFVPCHVTDGVNSWHFVISPSGVMADGKELNPRGMEVAEFPAVLDQSLMRSGGKVAVPSVSSDDLRVEYYSASGSTVLNTPVPVEPSVPQEPVLDYSRPPFQITDWSMLTFTQDNLIYVLDEGYWQEADGSVVVDRSEGHTIYWQSVTYEKGNPVYSMYLPPRPARQLSFRGRDAVVIDLGQDFTMAPAGSGQNPLPTLCIDAFYGEEFSGIFPVDIYYKDLYQGSIDVALAIDKCPPPPPVIDSSSNLFYNREELHLSLVPRDNSKMFYSLEMMVSEASGFKDLSLDLPGMLSLMEADASAAGFHPYTGQAIGLESHQEHAHLFLVRAYSEDENGNRSQVVSRHFIVDPLNFYVVADSAEIADGGIASDGSLARPFTSVQQALERTASLDFVRIHLSGMVPVEGMLNISSNCEILGMDGESGLVLLPGGRIVAKDAQMVIKDCVLERQSDDGSELTGGGPALSVLNGSLSLQNCEVLGEFNASGTLISAVDSTVSVMKSGMTLQSGGYGALISGLRSHVIVDGGRFTVVAPTGIVFSLSAGGLRLSDSQCRIFGNLGRVAELSGVGYSLVNNEFHGVFKGRSATTAQLVPVWKDLRSKQIESRDNIISGFPGS